MLCPPPYAGFISQAQAQGNSAAAQEKIAERRLAASVKSKNGKFTSQELINLVNGDAPGSQGVRASLGHVVSAKRLLSRPLTPFEQRMVASNPDLPIARLDRYVVLTYETKGKRDQAAGQLRKQSEFDAVAEDEALTSSAWPTESTSGALGDGSNTNNLGNTQWGMHLMRFPQAWEKQPGQAWIAAIDNGIEPGHSDLVPNYRKHLSRNFYTPLHFDDPDELKDTIGIAGHGTHVATTMAGARNNGKAVGGCPECSLLAVRKLGSTLDTASQIVFAVDSGSQVINMSYEILRPQQRRTCTGTEASLPFCLAITYAARSGVAMSAAAGNYGNLKFGDPVSSPRPENWTLPANHPDVMAVSGLQNTWYPAAPSSPATNRTEFWVGGPQTSHAVNSPRFGSNFGIVEDGVPQISFAAPAQKVLAGVYSGNTWITGYDREENCGDSANPTAGPFAVLLPTDVAVKNNDGVGYCTGTSMAAPHVAAAAGLVKSANPLLDSGAVKSILGRSADCLGLNGIGKPCVEATPMNSVAGEAMRKLGYGVIQADKAVGYALGHAGALNRTTPLFAHFQQSYQENPGGGWVIVNEGHSHFYTTNPQMSMAAIRGTLQPRPRYRFGPKIWDCAAQANNCDADHAHTKFVSTLPDGQTSQFLTPYLKAHFELDSGSGFVRNGSSDRDLVGFNGSLVIGYNINNGFTPVSTPTEKLIASSKVRPVTPESYALGYEAYGETIPGYPYHPCGSIANRDSSGGLTSLSECKYFNAKAVAMLLTTATDPTATGSTLKKLYRVSCAPEDACNQSLDNAKKPYHVTFRYVSSKTDMESLTASPNSYKLDGVEGYVFDPAVSPPPDTVRLCSRRNPSQHDWVLFTEATTTPGLCNRNLDPWFGNQSTDYYADSTLLGYVYPVSFPKALPVAPHTLTQTQMNLDSRADIIWRATNNPTPANANKTSVWPMDSQNLIPAGIGVMLTVYGPEWQIAATGDFDGDGRTDIVWRYGDTSSLRIAFTSTDGVNASSTTDFTMPAGFDPVGSGDLNGDGRADLVLRNPTTGEVRYWLMYGSATPVSGTYYTMSDTNWKVVAIGDFNGDGRADIYLRHTGSGNNVVWLTNPGGTTITGYNSFHVADLNWKIAGKGDFNGDGKIDLIWWNESTNMVVIWYMNGATWQDYSILPIQVPAKGPNSWILAATGDYNGDGITDIFWRRDDGVNAIWFINESTVNSWATAPSAPTEWVVQNRAVP